MLEAADVLDGMWDKYARAMNGVYSIILFVALLLTYFTMYFIDCTL